MGKNTWKIPAGLRDGACLFILGMILQLNLGPFEWSWLACPVNLIMLLGLVALIGLLFFLRVKADVIPPLVWTLFLMLVMGFVPQVPEGGIPRLSQMLSFWPFVLLWSWTMVHCGLYALQLLVRFKWEHCSLLLMHLGFFVAVVAAALGSADRQELEMTVAPQAREFRALTENNEEVLPGFTVELHDFTIEYHKNHMPKRYASDITVTTREGKTVQGTVEVNKPLKADGWNIYQYAYDDTRDSGNPSSIFLLVKDPWLPGVYAGIFLMLSGALALVVARTGRRSKKGIAVSAALMLLAALFVYLFTPLIRVKMLMPALQSPWFAPHVIVYMFAYALLSAATLMALYILIFRRNKTVEKEMNVTDNLVYAGFAFLTFGMLFGALWAKEAWGHFWGWDPKETWAAITWLCYLLYIHFRQVRPQDGKNACRILLLAFVCLVTCWWGVNYLPSARGLSDHTYN